MRHLSKYIYHFFAFFLVLVLVQCSTEKNTFTSRWYHQTTAKYNGYFNARELIRVNMSNYRDEHKDDYTQRLPIEIYPDKEQAQQMYPDMDTAISKSEKVIAKHSMPNPAKNRRAKKEEHNKWIDDTWLVIGQAHYIKKEYDEAIEKLKYVRSSYSGQQSVYAANMWLARIYMDQGNIPQATKHLKDVDRALEKLEKLEEDKSKKSYKKKSKEEKKNEPEKFPKKWEGDLLLLKARLALLNEEKEEGIKLLEEALDDHVRKRDKKGRVAFILGQLYQDVGRGSDAAKYYKLAIRKAPQYEMEFQARINRAIALGAEGEGLEKELHKMAKDEKNIEFKDQIYYALADISFQKGDKKQGISYLHKSAFFSINNNRQKGMSYLRLADIHFDDKKFVKAYGYYDSAVSALPKDYPNYEAIKYKSESLNDLVENFEIVERQDSLLAIATLEPEAREKRLAEIADQIKKEKEEEKRREQERMKQLEQMKTQMANSGGGNGSDWYFYNRKLSGDGVNEFKRIWGDRKLEDNWRRSTKTVNSFANEEEGDSTQSGNDEELSIEELPADSISTELLAKDLPLTDAAIDSSQNLLYNSLYRLGVIYREQLNDQGQAEHYFTRVADNEIDHEMTLPAAFQLFRMLETSKPAKSNQYKDFILNNYPNSDFANAIRDPEFYSKQEERKAEERLAYEELYEKYEKGYYGLVIAKVNRIQGDSLNPYIPKYLLLKAFAISKTGNATVSAVRSPLDDIIENYPNTPEAAYAKKIIENYKKGFAEKETEKVTFDEELYAYDPSEEHILMFVPGERVNANAVRAKLTNFKNQYFRNESYTVINIAMGKGNLVVVKIFENLEALKDFTQTYDNSNFTRDPILKNCSYMMISKSNFATLNKQQDLAPYETFYNAKYKEE